MPEFKQGDAVAVPASVQQGAFPGEYLVEVPARSGPISGFVRERDFVELRKTIQGIVRESTSSSLSVKLSGSYFTTNGLAEFAPDWAKANVKVVA